MYEYKAVYSLCECLYPFWVMMIIALEEEAMGDQKRSDKWFASNYSIERDFSTYGLLIDVPRVCKWCNQTIITLGAVHKLRWQDFGYFWPPPCWQVLTFGDRFMLTKIFNKKSGIYIKGKKMIFQTK